MILDNGSNRDEYSSDDFRFCHHIILCHKVYLIVKKAIQLRAYSPNNIDRLYIAHFHSGLYLRRNTKLHIVMLST